MSDARPQNENVSLCPIFHCLVNLHFILKTFSCLRIIAWDNESE